MKNYPNHPVTGHECRFHEDAALHFTGEIYLAEFHNHLKECPSCQEVATVLQRLRSLPAAEIPDNLTAHILSAIQQPKTKYVRSQYHLWAAAAMVVIGVTTMSIWQFGKKPTEILAQEIQSTVVAQNTDRSVKEALDWFCRSQEADGSWSPARWGGDPRFKVALTALPMLAILSADSEKTPQRGEVIAKARQYLQSTCDRKGRFGPQFYGSSYSQGIATLALLSCYKNNPDEESKRLLDKALAVIVSQQHANGWWGLGGNPQPDLSITLWQVEALKMAVDLGWKDVNPYLSLGTKWVVTHSHNDSTLHNGLTSGGEVDYFNAYFTTTLLKSANDESSRQRLASIRHALLGKQIQRGNDSGSWTPDDRWGMAGGRLYTTALASLSLH
jgi:hypothetical protein